MTDQEIYIIGAKEDDIYAKGSSNWDSVRIEDLKNNLSVFLQSMSTLFAGVEESIGNLELKEISINTEISANGKIGLIGSVESGIKGGLTIKLTRKTNDD